VTTVAVRPGDAVTALVRYSPSSRKFRLSLTDHTSGRKFAISQRCQHGVTCARTSAEVISEAPATVQNGKLVLLPLADYQAAEFTAIGITQGGASGGIASRHWRTTKIVQVRATDNAVILARPTPVHADVFANYWARQR
jgi:Peptidase A4 family